MRVIASSGRKDIAVVYIGEFSGDRHIEFVEAVQPPIPRDEKWVLMVSTLFGCPVGCSMCDAGGSYMGRVSKEDIFAQIDHMVLGHYPDRVVPCEQFKIQFARMGEPSFNMAVLDVLDEFPQHYDAPGFMPSISTIAPAGADAFFDRLIDVKNRMYPNGQFQFQFSIHTTDNYLRDKMIPVKKWGFSQMAEFGERYYQPGDRKVTLNFALAEGMPVDPAVLLENFSPEKFLIKITPLNPTYQAVESGLSSYIDISSDNGKYEVIESLRAAGYRVILSIGELEENNIGSNCGQYVKAHLRAEQAMLEGYTYNVDKIP